MAVVLTIPLSHFMREISYHKCCSLFSYFKHYKEFCFILALRTFLDAWLYRYFPGCMVILSQAHGYTILGAWLYFPGHMVILSWVHCYTFLGALLYFTGCMVILMSHNFLSKPVVSNGFGVWCRNVCNGYMYFCMHAMDLT